MSYAGTIEYLYSLQKHGTKLGLANTLALMNLVGDPHEAFRSVHIAGTNGKGSTAAMLASILQRAGYTVGLYTSPHLISFTERIQVSGEQIPEEKVIELTESIRRAIDGLDEPFVPTFFEFTTTLAFTWFAEQKVDIVVVETGMGGRLDSTNVITPLVSVITSVDLDHQEFLGERIEDIAYEKAGIIKEGVPVVTGERKPEVLAVIEATSLANNAVLYRAGRDCSVSSVVTGIDGGCFDYRGLEGEIPGVKTTMIGKHQVENASLALLATEVLRRRGLTISQEAVREGLAAARWAGRLEKMAGSPLIVIDGAHNPAAAARLAETLKDEFAGSYDRLVLVLGILGDKDMDGIVKPLAALADRVVVTAPAYYRASDPARMKAVVKQYHPHVEEAASVADAIDHVRATTRENDLICIAGSLFTAGEARGIMLGIALPIGTGSAVPGLAGLKG
ncbi:MAG: bifunctional folylpolyglutamate synthase/dihydrofolate synthase [Nitrospirota bacterium]|nr:bifunctional folylpolyglutamate synthase/dihydrofolate synthase [Nitrospirota bacterium]